MPARKVSHPPWVIPLLVFLLIPQVVHANVQSILARVQMQLQQLLPFAAMVALVIAGYYFFIGDASGRQRVIRIIIGIFIGLAAVHIVNFLQGMAR